MSFLPLAVDTNSTKPLKKIDTDDSAQVKAFWYFFGGIIVFGFYIANLFVGVMFEAFLSYKNMNSSGGLISQAERRWRDYEKRLYQVSLSLFDSIAYTYKYSVIYLSLIHI